MIQLIRNRTIIGFVIGFVLILFSKLGFENTDFLRNINFTPLFLELLDMVNRIKYLSNSLALVLIIIGALLLTSVINTNKLLSEKSIFPFIIYCIVFGIYLEQLYFNPILLVNILLILMIKQILSLQENEKFPAITFINIGTLLGLNFLIFKEAIFLIPIIIICILFVYNFKFNLFIILILAMFIPMFLSIGIYYLLDSFDTLIGFFKYDNLNVFLQNMHFQPRFYLGFLLFHILFLFALFHFRFNSSRISKKSKRYYGIFNLLWILPMILVCFSKTNIWINFGLFAIPFTVYMSNLLQSNNGKEWLKYVLLFVLIIGILSIQFNY